MKKTLAVFTIAAIALTMTASPAFAKNKGNDDDRGGNSNGTLRSLIRWFDKRDDDKENKNGLAADQFMLSGTIGSKTTGSIVVNVKTTVNVPTLTNSLATVNVDANTKIKGNNNQVVLLADIQTGAQVVVTGTVSGSTLTAQNIHVNVNKNSNQFSLTGTVGSTTSGSIVVTVTNSRNLPTLTNNIATVNVDANTKFKAQKNQTVTLADVKAGMQVSISGTVSGTTLTGQTVQIKLPKGKAYGEVTAKTDTSVTVKNTVTGVTQTINTDADTKVKINGEVKTVTDVQVGDKGYVKFKTRLTGLFAKIISVFR